MEKILVIPGVLSIPASDFIRMEEWCGSMYLYYRTKKISEGLFYNTEYFVEKYIEIPKDKVQVVEDLFHSILLYSCRNWY